MVLNGGGKTKNSGKNIGKGGGTRIFPYQQGSAWGFKERGGGRGGGGKREEKGEETGSRRVPRIGPPERKGVWKELTVWEWGVKMAGCSGRGWPERDSGGKKNLKREGERDGRKRSGEKNRSEKKPNWAPLARLGKGGGSKVDEVLQSKGGFGERGAKREKHWKKKGGGKGNRKTWVGSERGR